VSFRALLTHRVTVERLEETNVDGAATYEWRPVASNVMAFVDLSYSRPGVDRLVPPEAGRPTDRSGVAFFLPEQNVSSGDRIKLTRGLKGTFMLDGRFDEVPGRHGTSHHIEVGCTEVPNAQHGGSA
jgi:hypothetical protein